MSNFTVKTYCGNNSLFTGLVNGTHVLGSNYQCLRKGIQTGNHLPYDPNYNNPYAPIDKRKFYCGNKENLPNGYFAKGSPSKCLQKGIGVGKSMRARREVDDSSSEEGSSGTGSVSFAFSNSKKYPYICIATMLILIFIALYIIKPRCITRINHDKKVVIDWGKFICYYVCTIILISTSIYVYKII